jgi:hypothetical protein
MSRGLGRRQRAILARLVEHHELARLTERPPRWITVRELAGLLAADAYGHHLAALATTRRALRALEAAGLVELALVRLEGSAQTQLGARLRRPDAPS